VSTSSVEPAGPAAPTTRAHRRGAARDAILVAARRVFGSRGYAGPSMRDIAQEAEVSPALLYRYFPTKSQLFEEAVIEPYHGFVESFLDSWDAMDTRLSNEEMVSRFVRTLYGFVIDNRDVMFAMLVANRFGEHENEAPRALSAEVHKLAEFTAREAVDRGLVDVDLEMATACTIALVFSIALLDDFLFSPGSLDHERLIEQVCRYAAAGVQQKP
jgi:AcrR family transcriptional regulator